MYCIHIVLLIRPKVCVLLGGDTGLVSMVLVFLFVCLHLLRHALYFLWMDFHPCLYTQDHFFLINNILSSEGKFLCKKEIHCMLR